MPSKWLPWSLSLSLALAWLLISLAPLVKYLGRGRGSIAAVFTVAAIVIIMRVLDRQIRSGRQISAGWLALPMAALTAAFVALYPRSLRLPLWSRTDREDALRIVLNSIQHHRYPYGERTFLGHSLTPLPGAALLAAPFYAMGHIAWQNLFWLAAFCIFALRFFRFRATALLFVTVFLLCAPANLSDITAGGDYIDNFIYMAIAVTWLHSSLKRKQPEQIAAATFLGIALSSRAVYALILLPLAVAMLQRVAYRRVLLLLAVTVAAAAAFTLPVFAPYPMAHLLQQMAQGPGKLRDLPAALHAQRTLPALGLLVTFLGCLLWKSRMDLPRVFLTFSAATFAILAPPVAALVWVERGLPYDLSYLSMCVLPFVLWAFARYEQAIEKR